MKCLIIYSTKYGATQIYAQMIADHANYKIDSQNVKDITVEKLQDFDTVVLGSSIYVGKVNKSMQKFCEKYEDILLTKRLYLFINGLLADEELAKELANAYTDELRKHATHQVAFGGKVNFSKLKFMDKKIMRMVSKQDPRFEIFDNSTNLSLLNEEDLISFAKLIK